MLARTRPSRRRRAVVLVALAALLVVSHAPPAAALNDPLFSRQWGLGVIGAPLAWERNLYGTGIDIAVVDTGVHRFHQDLDGNIRPGLNLLDGSKPAQDDHGHGTHVAGIAAASIDDGGGVGVAPRAGIVPVKGLDRRGSGDLAVLAEGVRWAADNGAEVINMSFGPELGIVFSTPRSIIDAIHYAWSRGAICVIAAGNDFISNSDLDDVPGIVVSATTRRDTIADFSNGVGNAKWALAAPGGGNTIQFEADEGIWSTAWVSDDRVDTYVEESGTSMAAPFVSGAVALLRGAGLSPQQTVDRLLATAKDLGSPGRDSVYGSGRLDVGRATEGLGATSPPPATQTTSAPSSGSGSPTTAAPRSPGASPSRPPATLAPPPVASTTVDSSPTTAAPDAPSQTTDSTLPRLSAPDEPSAVAADDPVTARRLPIDDGVSPLVATIGALAVLAVAGAAMRLVVARRRLGHGAQ